MIVSVEEIFGWSASCFTILSYIFIMKETITSFRIKGKYKTIPKFIRIENIMNYFVCSNWLIYTFIFHIKHLFICDLIGTIIYFLWIIFIYLIYFRKINCFKYLIFILLAIIYIPGLYFLFQYYKKIGGPICSAFHIISFCTSILLIKEIIITKDYKIIKINICILSLFGHFCWFIYGFIIINLFIVIPHVIGFIIIFINSFFWNTYKKKSNLERLGNRSVDIMRNKSEVAM